MAKINDKRHVRKTDVPVVLTPDDLQDIINLFGALKALGGGLVDGDEFTVNNWVYMFDDIGLPVYNERMAGVVGWFRMDAMDAVTENVVFVPNKYVEVVREHDEV